MEKREASRTIAENQGSHDIVLGSAVEIKGASRTIVETAVSSVRSSHSSKSVITSREDLEDIHLSARILLESVATRGDAQGQSPPQSVNVDRSQLPAAARLQAEHADALQSLLDAGKVAGEVGRDRDSGSDSSSPHDLETAESNPGASARSVTSTNDWRTAASDGASESVTTDNDWKTAVSNLDRGLDMPELSIDDAGRAVNAMHGAEKSMERVTALECSQVAHS